MSKLVVKALCMSLAATFALGLTACSKQAATTADGTGAAAASSVAVAGSAPAGAQATAGQPGAAAGGALYAQVVSVQPVSQEAGPPQQVCHDETVYKKVPPKDQHRIAGTVIGAVAGGLLGHMIGGGKGNALATVAGAAGGGYAGNRIEANAQNHNVKAEVVRRCTTVATSGGNIAAYEVTYVFNGVTRTTRMDHDPGSQVMVQPDGVVAVSSAQ
ncbi:MAG TPA: glycine zipper 2TM domain-containing protein [Dyella sp.]|uniref:glycine zipper 2TM domain-containing protein n=1 Tax=Dyella sp. TaxID=1869338 RepID=UPI002C9CFD62|nr:glycine zipper 2TM domain-containing protein [Dyella sp.]HTV86595.1 glycine zipper 2TM domain-containing protein [Dyella sp.]